MRNTKKANQFKSHRAKFRFKYQREKVQTLSYEKRRSQYMSWEMAESETEQIKSI